MKKAFVGAQLQIVDRLSLASGRRDLTGNYFQMAIAMEMLMIHLLSDSHPVRIRCYHLSGILQLRALTHLQLFLLVGRGNVTKTLLWISLLHILLSAPVFLRQQHLR